METHSNGYRYYNYNEWGNKKYLPYDYEKNGLLRHLLSHVIIESKNETLQFLLDFIEKSFIITMKQVDRLKNFKNYAYK